MYNNMKLIEEGIRKDAKASQEKFAKEVASDVALSVVEEITSIVNQLDNKTSISQIKTKLEKVKEHLESLNMQSLLEDIGEVKNCIDSEQNTINGIDAKIMNQSETIEGMVISVSEVDLLLKKIINGMGDDFFQKIRGDSEGHKNKLEEILKEENDLSMSVNSIYSCVRNESGVSTIELLNAQDSILQRVSNELEKIDSIISLVDTKLQFELLKKTSSQVDKNVQTIEDIQAEIVRFSQMSDDMMEIKMDISNVQSTIQESFTSNDKQKLLLEIDEFRKKMKWLFWVNGITLFGVIGMFLLLLFK